MRTLLASIWFRLFKAEGPEVRMEKKGTAAEKGTIYGIAVKTIDGREKTIGDFRSGALLIVNTASECGFTPQYASLEVLHRKYAAKGLKILAFPANEFGAQEPGSEAEIKRFCESRYKVSFDLFSKVVAKGPGLHPLYAFLTTASGFPGDIKWNFTKFLVDGAGGVVARFEPSVDPAAKPVVGKIEELLGRP